MVYNIISSVLKTTIFININMNCNNIIWINIMSRLSMNLSPFVCLLPSRLSVDDGTGHLLMLLHVILMLTQMIIFLKYESSYRFLGPHVVFVEAGREFVPRGICIVVLEDWNLVRVE